MKFPRAIHNFTLIMTLLCTNVVSIGRPAASQPPATPAAPAAGKMIYLPLLQTYGSSGTTPTPEPTPTVSPTPTTPPSLDIPISTNAGDYPGGGIPVYQKLELTFKFNTTAQNLQLPYSTNPPAGLQPGMGISVDALFSPDNWQTVYRQPGFYYEGYQDEVRNGQEWFYPSGDFSWKVRFAPSRPGTWQYRIVVEDQQGQRSTAAHSFTAVASNNKGFIRVSPQDSRYFQYDNGSLFPALGYNMNYDHVSWFNPVLDNEPNFQKMGQNGIQLVRIWLSEWSIFGDAWNPWYSIDPEQHGQYIPYPGLTFEEIAPGSDVSMQVDPWENPCMFIGAFKAKAAVKPDTNYRVRVRYKTAGMGAATDPGQPHGFVAKVGDWMSLGACNNPAQGTPVTNHQSQNTSGWETLTGSWNSGDNNFLPDFYLVMENTGWGRAYVDYVWIEEDLGNGQYGPNIVSKPWMSHDLYMEQRNSYAFDKVVSLAEQYGVTLRPVLEEKNGWLFNHIDFQGQPVLDDERCWDGDENNDPAECPGNQWYYGNGRSLTKVRWLQQAWWRYLQARWGYSTAIHSWELLNEGDPFNGQHYTLADELGKYMHQFSPNDHLVSTSFWHSFPKDEFWANPEYPDVDFADIHMYVPDTDSSFIDTAQAPYDVGMAYGGKQPGGAGKPLIWGETGFITGNTDTPVTDFQADTQAIWLHNFLWAQLNPSALVVSYWYEEPHVYSGKQGDGSYAVDHRGLFGAFYRFIKDLPLNNGHYQDAQAAVSNPTLRAWGQKDLTNGHAHLWIQNQNHTWKNVVDGVTIQPASASLTLTGFQASHAYTLEWWDPYQSDPAQAIIGHDTLTAAADGSLVIPVTSLTADLALKITP